MTAHHKRTGDLAVQVLATTAAILLIAVEPAVARVLLTVLYAAAVIVAAIVIAAAVLITLNACQSWYFGWRERRHRARRPGYLFGGHR